MNEFKKDLACNITLISVLSFTLIHLLILTLNLFGVTELNFHEDFSYLVAYILVIVCLLLYIAGFFISKSKGLVIPAWFRMLFYIAFYLFTNVYHICGFYHNIYTIILFFAYVAFLVNIIALSVFYNVQKDEKNRLKSTSKFLITTVFFYASAINALIQFAINMFKAFIVPKYEFATLMTFVVEMSTMLLVTIVMTIIFSASLKKSKTLINGCLIKVGNNTPSTRTAKQ